MRKTWAFAVAGVLALAAEARSSDVWEIAGDDTATQTTNLLRPGTVQAGHDLSGSAAAPDQDWMRLVLKARHSYEARVSGVYWRHDTGPAETPTFDLVTADGTIVIPGQASTDDIVNGSLGSIGRTIRFTMGIDNADLYLRARGPEGVATDNTNYSVSFHDTTLFLPRWNNTSTQTTILVLQNTTSATVSGNVFFHDAAGSSFGSVGYTVPPRGVQVISTASLPVLAGQSGSALLVQGGPHGAIVGKAVALEAATGFTFDTPLVPAPR